MPDDRDRPDAPARPSAADNPFAAPRETQPADEDADEPELARLRRLRRELLTYEVNIKTIGGLMLLAAFVTLLASFPIVPRLFREGSIVEMLMLLLAVVGLAAAGVLLHRLRPLGRLIATGLIGVMLVLSLVALAVGSRGNTGAMLAGIGMAFLLPGIFVAALWLPKSTVVLGDHYREVVIPATADISRRTSAGTIVGLVVLLVLILIIMVSP